MSSLNSNEQDGSNDDKVKRVQYRATALKIALQYKHWKRTGTVLGVTLNSELQENKPHKSSLNFTDSKVTQMQWVFKTDVVTSYRSTIRKERLKWRKHAVCYDLRRTRERERGSEIELQYGQHDPSHSLNALEVNRHNLKDFKWISQIIQVNLPTNVFVILVLILKMNCDV